MQLLAYKLSRKQDPSIPTSAQLQTHKIALPSRSNNVSKITSQFKPGCAIWRNPNPFSKTRFQKGQTTRRLAVHCSSTTSRTVDLPD